MFFNIKDKFRFVTVSLLLGSLVTVISSASALEEAETFSFTVTPCSDRDTGASWSPAIDVGMSDSSVAAGDTGSVTVDPGFANGTTTCEDPSTVAVDGTVTSTVAITGETWVTTSACSGGGCEASASVLGISGTYAVPANETGAVHNGVFTLNWTPQT